VTVTERAPAAVSPHQPEGGEETPRTRGEIVLPSPRRLFAQFGARRLATVAVAGLLAFVVSTAIVVYALGSLVHNRDQRALMASERTAIAEAAVSQNGLYRKPPPTQPPAPGTPVGILVVPVLGLQQVVVEGVGPSQTVEGPGHVPGTAGLGQPGNSAVVARRSGYGGPFGRLSTLHRGDHLVVATTQGESLYVVQSVATTRLVTRPPSQHRAAGPPSAARKATSTATNGHSHARTAGGAAKVVNLRTLYGPTSGNQLTLVTSASRLPWNTNEAVVVVARMRGLPFTPLPQESRSLSEQGLTGDPQALGWLVLLLLGVTAALVVAVLLYRRTTARSAYLLTTAPLLALTIGMGLAAGRLLPAWL